MSENAKGCIVALQSFQKSVTKYHNKLEKLFPSGKVRDVKGSELTDQDRSIFLLELSETKKKMDELKKHLDTNCTFILETKDSVHEDTQLRDNRGRQTSKFISIAIVKR